MKRIISIALTLLLCITLVQARVPKKRLYVTQVFNTDIVCHSCEKKIMDNVAVLGKGVAEVKVDVPTKQVAVTYDATTTGVEQLTRGFEKLGVKAQPAKEDSAETAIAADCCKAKAECGEAKKECCKAKAADGVAKAAQNEAEGCLKSGTKAEASQPACQAAREACCGK